MNKEYCQNVRCGLPAVKTVFFGKNGKRYLCADHAKERADALKKAKKEASNGTR